MNPILIAAYITGGATVIAACVGLVGRLRRKKASLWTNSTMTVAAATVSTVGGSASNIAVGNNITQNHTSTTHNHALAKENLSEGPSYKQRSKPSILDIKHSVESAKPYDKDHIAENYTGLYVCWPLSFSVATKSDQKHIILFNDTEASYSASLSVITIIDIGASPRIKSLAQGHQCWVRGKIKKVDLLSIRLEDDPEIFFD